MNLSHLPVGDGVRRRLENALSRLSHAYMISGPSERGRQALAETLAAACVCSGEGEAPCGSCSNCRKAAGKIHPDIIYLTIPEDKRIISVDQVRRLRADAYIRPNEARRKVFVIQDAHAMNESAQNALLKVLEDGPEYLTFLLLAEHPQQLLSTIRSRCESLSLVPLPGEESAAIDEELANTARELARLLASGEERALVEYTVGLESKKWDKDALIALLDGVENALRPELLSRPAQILPLVEHIRQVRKATDFNLGTGHLFGWLAAGR